MPKGSSDVEILLGGRILKLNTVFSLDGFDVCLAGKTGNQIIFRSLTTPYYTPEEIRYIKKIENIAKKREKDKSYVIDERFDGISEEGNIRLYRSLVSKIENKTFAKLPGAKLGIISKKTEEFEKRVFDDQIKCLEAMILYIKTNRASKCEMAAAGGGGGIVMSSNISNWKYNDIRIIDRSASGLFEKRSKNLKELL